jgi:hypothetical protein
MQAGPSARYTIVMARLLIGLFLGLATLQNAVPNFAQQPNLASLIPAAEVIVVARVTEADYSRTASDGPMIARAKVLRSIKGRLRQDQTFGFTETAWVGPNYKAGEVRVLFLESSGTNSWRIVSNLFVKADFLIEPDAISRLTVNLLKSILEKLPALETRRVLLTKDMLR